MPATRLPIIGLPALPDAPRRGAARRAGCRRIARRDRALGAPTAPAGRCLREVREGEDFAGALIASPHKEKAPPLSDALSDDARISGAVNVFVRAEGRLRGHNTDADGIRAGLESVLPRVKGKWPRNAVVLGAGGGARAVVAVLIGSGFQHVAVLNRHLHKAEALVAHFARSARHMELRARPWHDAIIEAELARAELLINASGIGLEEGESPIPTELLPPDRWSSTSCSPRAPRRSWSRHASAGGTVANGQGAVPGLDCGDRQAPDRRRPGDGRGACRPCRRAGRTGGRPRRRRRLSR